MRFSPSVIPGDPYGNNLREWTVVLESPDDGYLYLLVTSKKFSENACAWFRRVKDFQIGRAKINEERFTGITKLMTFDNLEESDIENSTETATISDPSGKTKNTIKMILRFDPFREVGIYHLYAFVVLPVLPLPDTSSHIT